MNLNTLCNVIDITFRECISFNGIGKVAFIESNMNAKYCIDIGLDNSYNSAQKLENSNSYYFQQDNDPKHSECITKLWFACNIKNQYQTSPQSLDLNQTGNV